MRSWVRRHGLTGLGVASALVVCLWAVSLDQAWRERAEIEGRRLIEADAQQVASRLELLLANARLEVEGLRQARLQGESPDTLLSLPMPASGDGGLVTPFLLGQDGSVESLFGSDVSDGLGTHPLFITLRDDDSRQVLLHGPMSMPQATQPVVVLATAIREGTRFLGVAGITFDAVRLAQWLRDRVPPSVQPTLLQADGSPLLVQGEPAQAGEGDLAAGAASKRLVAAAPVGAFGLQVQVSRDQSAAEARTAALCSGLVLLASTGAVLMLLGTGLLRHQLRVTRRARGSFRQLDQAVRLAFGRVRTPASVLAVLRRKRDGSIIDSMNLHANQAMLQLTGLDPGDEFGALTTEVLPRVPGMLLARETEEVLTLGEPRQVPTPTYHNRSPDTVAWTDNRILPMASGDDLLVVLIHDISHSVRESGLTSEQLVARPILPSRQSMLGAVTAERIEGLDRLAQAARMRLRQGRIANALVPTDPKGVSAIPTD